MDINLKKYITILQEDLLLGSTNEIIRANDTNIIGDTLTMVNLPTDAIVFGKIKRIDLIPFVINNEPNFIFDVRAYFDRGMPDEIQLNMTIWFQEEVISEEFPTERELLLEWDVPPEVPTQTQISSFQKNVLLKNSEFILDLQDIKDKVIKIDFRMGTKYYNIQDHFYKSWDLSKLMNSLYLYEYRLQEVPIPSYQLLNPTSLPNYLKDKTTKLQETINAYKIPNINKVPLKELAEKIYIYDIPWIPNLVLDSLDSTLVPEFRSGITKYLNNTLKGTLGEEQIFLRYPTDETRTSFRYYVFIDSVFYEITEEQERISSAYSILKSMTNVPLQSWSKTVFEKEQDIYSIDIESMHLCYIKYKSLNIADLRVRYHEYRKVLVKAMHAGELTYIPPVLNLNGNTYYTDGKMNFITGTMGDVYYYATQLN